jgi:hypothetical protein
VYGGREWRKRDGRMGREGVVGSRGGIARRSVRNVNEGRMGVGGWLAVSFVWLLLSTRSDFMKQLNSQVGLNLKKRMPMGGPEQRLRLH